MRSLSLTIGALIVLAACGSNASDSTDAGSTDTVTSPIAEFLGESYAFDDSEESRAQLIADERERQEVIAACMRDQGFDYIPVDPAETFFFEEPGELEWGSDEWVAKYGFGITTMWFSQEEVGPNLVGHDYAAFEEQASSDPNQAIVEEMSFSEQDAYYAALYGDQDFPEFDDTLSDEEMNAQIEELDFQPSGCEAEAYNNDEDSSFRFYEEFGQELDSVYERAQNDPRIVEAEQETSDCVADKGYTYTSEEDLYQQFDEQMAAIESTTSFPGDELTDEDFSTMSPEELDEIFNQPRVLSEEALATLGEIQAEEVAMAVAVNECGGGFANQGTLFQEIMAEYEQEFLDQNADRLADFKAEG